MVRAETSERLGQTFESGHVSKDWGVLMMGYGLTSDVWDAELDAYEKRSSGKAEPNVGS